MKKIFLALLITFLLVGSAAAHGPISKLPDSVQIMQYKMKLYLDENDLDSRNNLAMAYFRTDQLDEAKKELTFILEKDANNFDALDGMGVVLIKEGKAAAALDFLKRALKINDKDIMVHVHLSVAHDQLNQPDVAKTEMDKAKSLSSTPEEEKSIQEEVKLITNS